MYLGGGLPSSTMTILKTANEYDKRGIDGNDAVE
jgi:hypothetical protein